MQSPHPDKARTLLILYCLASHVDMRKYRDKILPNLDAQPKPWLSITLYSWQTEKYMTVIWYHRTEKRVFLLALALAQCLKIVIQIIKITSLRNQKTEKL